MKCKKCNEKNYRNNNFCQKCGYEFTDKEKKKAKRWSLVNILEKIEKTYSVCSFKFITDHILFKIGSIIVILIIGIFMIFQNGLSFKILKSKDYRVEYNKKANEYYVIVKDEDYADLKLYLPNKTKSINVTEYSPDGEEIIYSDKFNTSDKIQLWAAGESYYELEAVYDNNKLERLKVLIYRENSEY